MPSRNNAKVYTVLDLSIDDVIQLDDWDENGQHEFKKIYESMEDVDREELAQYVGEWLYDGDQWEEALRCGMRNFVNHKNTIKQGENNA